MYNSERPVLVSQPTAAVCWSEKGLAEVSHQYHVPQIRMENISHQFDVWLLNCNFTLIREIVQAELLRHSSSVGLWACEPDCIQAQTCMKKRFMWQAHCIYFSMETYPITIYWLFHLQQSECPSNIPQQDYFLENFCKNPYLKYRINVTLQHNLKCYQLENVFSNKYVLKLW